MNTIDRIFKLLEKNHMTAKDLSIAVGLSGGNITDWKTGRSKPSISSLNKIANYFNVSVDYLIGNTDKSSYSETLTKYLIPLGLNSNQFDLFYKMALSYINKDEPETTASILRGNDLSKEQMDKIFVALEYFADMADEFQKTTKLNKVSYTLSKNSIEKSTNKDSYAYNIESIETSDIVKEGLIKALNDLNKSLIISKNDHPTFYLCPVYGKISAGQPNWAEECLDGYLPIDPTLMNINSPDECFFLRVDGESMNKVIKNGAYALIRKTDFVDDGEIAVVLVNGFDATLKKFSKQGDFIVLEPMSDDPSIKTQIYTKDTSIKVIGKYLGKFEINQ